MAPFIPPNVIQAVNVTNENLEVVNAPKKRGRKQLSVEQKAANKLSREAAKRAKI